MRVKHVFGATIAVEAKTPALFLIKVKSTGNSGRCYEEQYYDLKVTFQCCAMQINKEIPLVTSGNETSEYSGDGRLYRLLKDELSGTLTEKQYTEISDFCMKSYLNVDFVQEKDVLQAFYKAINYTIKDEED